MRLRRVRGRSEVGERARGGREGTSEADERAQVRQVRGHERGRRESASEVGKRGG